MPAAVYLCGSLQLLIMKTWLKKMGIGAFLFFLIKGLLWLAVIFLGIDLLEGC